MGQLSAALGLSATVLAKSRVVSDNPDTDLRSWPSISVLPEISPVRNGYAKMPMNWVRCTPQLTNDGSYVTGARPEQDDVQLSSNVRWLPYTNSYNTTTGDWIPWFSTKAGYRWRSNALTRPTLETLTYRQGRELISVGSMRVRGGSFFYSDFNSGLDDAVAFTLSLAVWLHGAGPRAYSLLDSAQLDLTVSESLNFQWADAMGSVSAVGAMTTVQPGYITVVVNPPVVTTYLSLGPGYTFKSDATAVYPPSSTPLAFSLGKALNLGTGEFNLFEANLWDFPLSDDEVTALNSSYASMYGVSRER